MKSAIIAAITVSAFALTPGAFAQEKAGGTIYGVGLTQTCATWVASRQSGANVDVLHAWIDGFLSQADLSLADLKRTDQTGIDFFLDHYCLAHPTVRLDLAASALVGQLRQH